VIRAYAVDAETGKKALLTGSPMTIACAPPPEDPAGTGAGTTGGDPVVTAAEAEPEAEAEESGGCAIATAPPTAGSLGFFAATVALWLARRRRRDDA
jgi:MYXO-CTERM domain-containing protein